MKLRSCIAYAILASCLPVSTLAQGPAVWRCGQDGRSFSDTPCAEGRQVATADPRPAADVQAAREVARREERLANRLRDERAQREAIPPGAGLAGIGPVKERFKPPEKRAPHKRHRVHKHSAEDGIWPAVAPVSRQKKG